MECQNSKSSEQVGGTGTSGTSLDYVECGGNSLEKSQQTRAIEYTTMGERQHEPGVIFLAHTCKRIVKHVLLIGLRQWF